MNRKFIYEAPELNLDSAVLENSLCEVSTGGEGFVAPEEGDDYVIF